jgi:hypothetical protein
LKWKKNKIPACTAINTVAKKIIKAFNLEASQPTSEEKVSLRKIIREEIGEGRMVQCFSAHIALFM